MNELAVGLGHPLPGYARDGYPSSNPVSAITANLSQSRFVTAAVSFFAYAQLFLILRQLLGPEATIF